MPLIDVVDKNFKVTALFRITMGGYLLLRPMRSLRVNVNQLRISYLKNIQTWKISEMGQLINGGVYGHLDVIV